MPVLHAVAALAALALTAGDNQVTIGHVASLTGNEATFGDSTDKGIKLAIEEQNKKGGVKGKKIVLKTLDDQGKPEQAALMANRLIKEDRVSVIIGEVASSRTLAMAPLADNNRVPLISTASTNPRVTKNGAKTRPYVFRICFIDPFQGTVMAKFSRENLKFNKVAILRDVGNDYSVGLSKFFEDKFKSMGGQIVANESFKAGDSDFKAQLTSIKGKGPEAIYVPAYYTDVALIARQARELGMTQPLMGGDGWDSSKLFEIAQGALDGSYYSNHYTSENPAPLIQDFVAKYKKVYGTVPDALAVLGYDAARIAMASMEKAKDLTGPSIRDEIEKTKGFEAVSGSISLDAEHNPSKSAVVLSIKSNAAKYAATVSP